MSDGLPLDLNKPLDRALVTFMVALSIAANERGHKHSREHYERWFAEAAKRLGSANDALTMLAAFDAEVVKIQIEGAHP